MGVGAVSDVDWTPTTAVLTATEMTFFAGLMGFCLWMDAEMKSVGKQKVEDRFRNNLVCEITVCEPKL